MAKNTMGTKLPRKLEQKMQIVGEQIKPDFVAISAWLRSPSVLPVRPSQSLVLRRARPRYLSGSTLVFSTPFSWRMISFT